MRGFAVRRALVQSSVTACKRLSSTPKAAAFGGTAAAAASKAAPIPERNTTTSDALGSYTTDDRVVHAGYNGVQYRLHTLREMTPAVSLSAAVAGAAGAAFWTGGACVTAPIATAAGISLVGLQRAMLRSPKAGAQDMTGKVCIVTGGSSDGVGRQTAAGLLAMGATVIISYRTGDAEAARQGVLAAARKWKWAAPQSAAAVDADAAADAMAARLVAWPLTLEDRVSVSRFANTARSAYPKGIDVLVNNAGAMLDLGDVENTKNGIEYHIDVNFLGPYQLTELLAPQLAKRRAQGGGRVVNVVHPGFGAARGARLIEDVYGRRFREDRPEPGFMQGRQIYAAKLGLVCQSLSLHQRGLPACVVYPGRVASQLRRLLAPSMCTTFYYPMVGLVMRTPYEGAQSVVHAAAMPTATFPSGSYMSNCTPRLNWKSRTVYDAAQRESILHWAGRQTSTPLVDLPRFS